MTDGKADELIAVLTRIAVALEAPVAPAPTGDDKQPPQRPDGIDDCAHVEKMRVYFMAADEWECSLAKGGCGYRSPALVAGG